MFLLPWLGSTVDRLCLEVSVTDPSNDVIDLLLNFLLYVRVVDKVGDDP